MFKLNRDSLKGFTMGAITVALFGSLLGTTYASGKLTSINIVKGGIKLFVDGKLVKPTDSDGKVVEPFIYDGTTYLPLRALSNALTNNQKQVKWDAGTSSIYVGQAPVAAQTSIEELKYYEGTQGKVLTGEDASFQILDKKITPFNRLDTGYAYPGEKYYSDAAEYIYILNSNYRELSGQFTIPYTGLGADFESKIQFYSVNKKGNKTLIKEIATKVGDDIQQVSVNVQGVEILQIEFDKPSAFYNITLSGIQ
ncbi:MULTISPECIES: stalk domain-containing protein [Paenibacillus]|uniref:stalk domain-containing protein n=1 Tax=Paenibacillus TaxID=44249 RepID=UPI000970136D|nr:hypothetical protein [Paenibacillus odorifer]OME34965.1 hypothetical protein BSK58_24985 [Paenibacillus odorifer]